MTHVSCRDGQLINTSPVNQSMNDEEITLDENIVPNDTNVGNLGADTPTIEEENDPITTATTQTSSSCISGSASVSVDEKIANQGSEEQTKGEEDGEEELDPFSTYNEETRLQSQTPDRSLSSRLFKR
jgi:hypothetical protein